MDLTSSVLSGTLVILVICINQLNDSNFFIFILDFLLLLVGFVIFGYNLLWHRLDKQRKLEAPIITVINVVLVISFLVICFILIFDKLQMNISVFFNAMTFWQKFVFLLYVFNFVILYFYLTIRLTQHLLRLIDPVLEAKSNGNNGGNTTNEKVEPIKSNQILDENKVPLISKDSNNTGNGDLENQNVNGDDAAVGNSLQIEPYQFARMDNKHLGKVITKNLTTETNNTGNEPMSSSNILDSKEITDQLNIKYPNLNN